MAGRLAVVCLLLAWVPLGAAQSLGTIAKKERERREENKTKGSEVREFSDTEIFGEPDEANDDGDPTGDDDAQVGTSDESEDSGVSAESDDDPMAELDRQAQERRRDEARWRARFGDARQEVQAAKEYRKALDELYLSQGERYVDENGDTVIQDLGHLRQLISEADQRVADAERSLAQLEDQARREGIPPGWRR